MDARHDWFAEVAESWIRYLFSIEGFEVFGASKWGADLVAHCAKAGTWCRCEVRSSNTKPKPVRKRPAKLKDRAEILAEVTLDSGDESKLCVVLTKLDGNGRKMRGEKWPPGSGGSLGEWIKRASQQPSAPSTSQ